VPVPAGADSPQAASGNQRAPDHPAFSQRAQRKCRLLGSVVGTGLATPGARAALARPGSRRF
jgi:hypothetical protein